MDSLAQFVLCFGIGAFLSFFGISLIIKASSEPEIPDGVVVQDPVDEATRLFAEILAGNDQGSVVEGTLLEIQIKQWLFLHAGEDVDG